MEKIKTDSEEDRTIKKSFFEMIKRLFKGVVSITLPISDKADIGNLERQYRIIWNDKITNNN